MEPSGPVDAGSRGNVAASSVPHFQSSWIKECEGAPPGLVFTGGGPFGEVVCGGWANAPECRGGLRDELRELSVIPVFSRASAGVRSRLAGIGGQKSETEASSLAEVFFFESHIRSTNAPARRISVLLILLIMSKNPVCWHLLLPVNPENLGNLVTFPSLCPLNTKKEK
jgi:hypothetical protein